MCVRAQVSMAGYLGSNPCLIMLVGWTFNKLLSFPGPWNNDGSHFIEEENLEN